MGKLSIEQLENFNQDIERLAGKHADVVNAHPKEFRDPLNAIRANGKRIHDDATEKGKEMPGKIA